MSHHEVIYKAAWAFIESAQNEQELVEQKEQPGKDTRTIFRCYVAPDTNAVRWETYEEFLPRKSKNLVIFDWDDTLFPSSFLSADIPSRRYWLEPNNEQLLLRYDKGLAKVLEPFAAIPGPNNQSMPGDTLHIAISSWSGFSAEVVGRMPQTKALLERLGVDINEAPLSTDGVKHRGYYVAHKKDKRSHHKWLTHRTLQDDGTCFAVGDNATPDCDFSCKDVRLESQTFYGIKLPYEEGLKRQLHKDHCELVGCTDPEVWRKLRISGVLTPETAPYNDGQFDKLLAELRAVVQAIICTMQGRRRGLKQGDIVRVEDLLLETCSLL